MESSCSASETPMYRASSSHETSSLRTQPVNDVSAVSSKSPPSVNAVCVCRALSSISSPCRSRCVERLAVANGRMRALTTSYRPSKYPLADC